MWSGEFKVVPALMVGALEDLTPTFWSGSSRYNTSDLCPELSVLPSFFPSDHSSFLPQINLLIGREDFNSVWSILIKLGSLLFLLIGPEEYSLIQVWTPQIPKLTNFFFFFPF